LFDDLIPAAARNGGAAGGWQGAVAPEYQPVPDPWLGLKDAKTGIPLVREFKPGRFIAEITGEDDGGVYWKDPNTGEIRRQGPGELIVPEGGKYKVYERLENIRPWTWTDMALIQGIKSGFTAPYDAFAGNMAPSEVIPRALDVSTFAGGPSPVKTWRPRVEPAPVRPELVDGRPSYSSGENGSPLDAQRSAPGGNTPEGQAGIHESTSGDPGVAQSSNNHLPDESGTGTTGPPPDQDRLPQNGAPSGAVSTSWGEQIVRIPSHRIVGRPKKRGQPPIGDDGYPLERHHVGQVQDGLIMEMTREDHRLGENYAKNHQNVGQAPSLIDRLRDRANRRRHWAELHDSFDNLPLLTDNQVQELQRATQARIQAQRQRFNN
jgi:hypothetical protein